MANRTDFIVFKVLLRQRGDKFLMSSSWTRSFKNKNKTFKILYRIEEIFQAIIIFLYTQYKGYSTTTKNTHSFLLQLVYIYKFLPSLSLLNMRP